MFCIDIVLKSNKSNKINKKCVYIMLIYNNLHI